MTNDETSRSRNGPRALSPILDHLAVPTLIVAADGRVISLNRAARTFLTERCVLTVVRSSLRAGSREATRALKQALDRACNAHAEGCWEVVHCPASASTLALCIVSLVNKTAGQTLAAVFVFDSDHRPEIAPDVLTAVYGFSRAEARVVAALVRVGSIEKVAAALFLSVHTVRTHVKSVLARSGAKRQSDLVRMLVSGPGAIVLAGDALITPDGRCIPGAQRITSNQSNKKPRGKSR